MRHLISLLVLVLSFSSVGQVTIKRDALRSYCKEARGVVFNISPNNEWTLEHQSYNALDSIRLNIFQGIDTLNKIRVMTFYKDTSGGTVQMNIQNPFIEEVGVEIEVLSHSTWSENLDTVYIFLRNSTLNTGLDWEGFAIDISSITGVGIKNPSNNFPTKRVKALNKPNPFRSSTFIQYSIPKSDYVAINIYNNQGRLLRVLKQKYQKAGTHSVKWDGKDNNGNRMANGEYYYQIISGDLITTKKMIFLK